MPDAPDDPTESEIAGAADKLQGRPQLRLQKSYQFQVQKTNPKTSLLYLLVLIMTIFPFLLC